MESKFERFVRTTVSEHTFDGESQQLSLILLKIFEQFEEKIFDRIDKEG